jgi:hypothetical protein
MRSTPLLALSLVLAAAPLASGCGEQLLVKPPTVAEADDQVATCKIARDPLNPLIVEWPGTSKVELDSTSKRGLVIVSYIGCNLKVLSNCRAQGAYGFTGVTPARDTIEVASVTDLYARLPLGAASLKGELSNGSKLSLEYIAVGLRRAESEPVTLTGECAGATHYVDRMTLGAYSLDAIASGSVGGGIDVGGAGVGGGRKENARRLRGSGELSRCDGKAPNAEGELASSGCGAILQIGLSPLQAASRPLETAVTTHDAGPPSDTSFQERLDKVRRSGGSSNGNIRSGGGDRDGDGIRDDSDKCPDDPEDMDGFEDADGCPDPDNDQDGIADMRDQCPMDPEDKDGFQDEDGCPDPDNDRDGLGDASDKCPSVPENLNGYQDDDGCPDDLPRSVK